MKMCDRCPGAGGCLLNYNGKACQNWRAKNAPDVVYTNADRIRAMSDEELAGFLCGVRSDNAGGCDGCIAYDFCIVGHMGTIDWLQQPAEDEDSEDEE